jgi:anti-sigma-K factor RskA
LSTHDERYLDLLPAYAIDALDPVERAALVRHLESGCAACVRELALWRDVVVALAASVPPEMPSETTRARILAATAPVVEAPPPASVAERGSGRSPWIGRLAAAAALAALAVGAWTHFELRREIGAVSRRLGASAARLADLESDLASTRTELARLRLVGGIAASPETRLVALAGLAEPGEAFGQALVDPIGRRAVFYAYGLRPTEEGKVYQLWFIAEGIPVSAGIFEVDDRGRAMLLVDDVAPVERIDAWAVTVEPDGGVAQPTGPMVLKG